VPVKRLLICALLTVLFQCAKTSVDPTSPPKQLPFDEFTLSTRLGSITVPAGSNVYYFDTWAVLRPNTTAQDTWHYYSTDNGSGTVPSECTRTYIKTGTVVTATVKCSLNKLGTLKANDLTWAQPLAYEVHMTANTSTLKMQSAVLKFADYNQTIDFTSQAEVNVSNVNGYRELVLGGSFDVTTNDNFILHIKCEVREKQN